MTESTVTTSATDPAIDPDLDARRAAFAAAVDAVTTTVAGIRPDQLDEPTPCDGMDVRQLLAHVLMAVGRTACAGRRDPIEAWPTGDEVAADDAWSAAIGSAAAEIEPAWADDSLFTEDIALPWATMSGASVLATYTGELFVHAWDLARATGQTLDVDEAAVEIGEAEFRSQLPTAERAEMWASFAEQMPEGIPFEAPFGDATPVADDAPAIVRLAAWCGRDV